MPIVFDHHQMHNQERPQTVEDAVRTYFGWAGIHDFSFESEYTLASQEVTSASGWDTEIIDQEVPVNVLVEYHAAAMGHGAVVRYDTNDDTFWIVGVDSNSVGYVLSWDGSSYTTLMQRSVIDMPIEGDFKIAFRQVRYSDDENDLWNTVSMWGNDRLLFTHLTKVSTALTSTYKFGLAAYGANRTFTNIRIPQLTEFTEWSSLDPGEAPAGGLTRALEGRYVKFFLRYNGSVRAWRPHAISSAFTFNNSSHIDDKQITLDLREAYNHVRMLGAYEIAEYVRDDLLDNHRHRFLETNNPYLMSEAECYDQARKETYRIEQQTKTGTISGAVTPLLEPEDRIAVEDEDDDFLISGFKLELKNTHGQQSMDIRKYAIG